jgi:IS605 OrfB family transposase
MSKDNISTFQTRIDSHPALQAYADRYNLVERKLYAQILAGKKPNKLKQAFLAKYGITARQFNAVERNLRGKISSVQELRKDHKKETKYRIKDCERKLEFVKDKHKQHNLKRRQHILETRLAKLEQPAKSLCFGSRKLFNSQFNSGTDHDAWADIWKQSRSSQFYVLGSHEETSGCQGCVATVQSDGGLTLKLRLPDALVVTHGKWVEIHGVYFNHGHERVLQALILGNTPINYRFKLDDIGWRVFVSVHVFGAKIVTRDSLGRIGLDLNEDHIAVTETDRFGNIINIFIEPLVTTDLTTHQTMAVLGDAIKKIVAYAVSVQKPIVIEKLDFQKKRAELRGRGQTAKNLSSFAYSKFRSMVVSRCRREGVQVYNVNPAYTSIIGRNKFARRYGLTVHNAAALVIARRSMGLSENPNKKCYQGTSVLPVRNRMEHVWKYWAKFTKAQARDWATRSSKPGANHASCDSRKPALDPISDSLPIYCSGNVTRLCLS